MQKQDKSHQTCIFVLGMHRSGTSALTGVLDLLGVELGNKLMPGWEDNPKGFFENERIWRYNQKILESFGSGWDDPMLFGDEWCKSHNLDQHRSYISDILKEEFSDADVFAIKDPRMCLLFPLWSSVCEEIGVRVVCILPYRHPVEVASSLTKRNNFTRERGLLLWLNYVLTAEKVSRNHKRFYLRFDDLFADHYRLLNTISSGLEIEYPENIDNVHEDIVKFLDSALKHHSASHFDDSTMSQMVEELYGLLNRIAPGRPTIDWQDKVDTLRKRYQNFYSFFYGEDLHGLFGCRSELETLKERNDLLATERDRLLNENSTVAGQLLQSTETIKELELKIEEIRGTLMWKLAEKLRRVTGYKMKTKKS